MDATINRRSFLKGATLAAAGLAVAGTAATDALAATAESVATQAGSATTEDPGIAEPDRWLSPAAKAWRTPKEPVNEDQITDGGTFDIVIVGGGQAGTWCAAFAAANGASVAVLESRASDAFPMYIGGELGVVNSQRGIEDGAMEVDPDEFMNECFRRNAGRSNQTIIREYVDWSGKILDWAIRDLDADWLKANTHIGSVPAKDSGLPSSENMVLDPSGYKFFTGTRIFRSPDATLADWNWGPQVMTPLAEQAQKDGAAWQWQTHAEYLEKDESGRVVAVVAQNRADSTYVRYTASKAVVLAGGDFQGNYDMLRDINDELRHMAESKGDITLAVSSPNFLERDGSSIAMGVWAGGHIEVGPHAGMNTGMAAPDAPWGPGTPLLNQNGKRFCDECAGGTEGAGYLGVRQPTGALVAVSDANWQETVLRMPPCHSAIDYAREQGWPTLVEAMEAVKPGSEPFDVPGYESTASVYCAETLEELFSVIGCYDEEQQKAAVAQMEHYNECARAGADDEFSTDPRIMRPIETAPFYAVVGSTEAINAGLCQTTGLDVNGRLQVLDTTLNPIEGLYAIGNSAGNRFCVQYATPLSGMSLGFCMVEGTLLGYRLATGDDALENFSLEA